jgi:hypothetical protein
MSLDEFRNPDDDDEFFSGPQEQVHIPEAPSEDRIFGLSPAQRMLLSVFLFLNVTIIGCLCLIALGRVQLPI